MKFQSVSKFMSLCVYQKKWLKVNTLPTWNIGKLPFQCKTKWQKINTIWNEIEDTYISIDCASFLSIDRTLFLCLETIPYIMVSRSGAIYVPLLQKRWGCTLIYRLYEGIPE